MTSSWLVPIVLTPAGGVLQMEGLVHASNPHVFQSGHAPGVRRASAPRRCAPPRRQPRSGAPRS